ncbi:MAG: hypothetical protein KAU20_01135 [Nanoarchaeota archaeon]|nr:hypothetical protein [Nanoarchaeota archaeon]
MRYAPRYKDHINSPVTASKVLTLDYIVRELAPRTDILKVLNIGSYDFPQHVGHTGTLEFSKCLKTNFNLYPEYYKSVHEQLVQKFGEDMLNPNKIFLLVAMNSDKSYELLDKKYKTNWGHGKIASHSQGERARQIANLGVVDGIVLFDGERASDVIKAYQPNVLTKGGDYVVEPDDSSDDHPHIDQEERKLVEDIGGSIILMPLGVDANGKSHHSYQHIRYLAEKHGFITNNNSGKQ